LDRTLLLTQMARLECRRYEQVLNAALPNVVPKCNYTKSFAKIKSIATNMSYAYYGAVIKNLPNALQVFD